MMEELYKVMDDLLDLEFQIKAGMDILKELKELLCVRFRKRGDRSRETGSADERIPAIYEDKSERNHSLYRRVNT